MGRELASLVSERAFQVQFCGARGVAVSSELMSEVPAEANVRGVGVGGWGALLLGLGILLRVVQYLAGVPVWGDQAGLGLNIVNRGFGAAAAAG